MVTTLAPVILMAAPMALRQVTHQMAQRQAQPALDLVQRQH
jgi:hypothetical protein